MALARQMHSYADEVARLRDAADLAEYFRADREELARLRERIRKLDEIVTGWSEFPEPNNDEKGNQHEAQPADRLS